MAPNPGSEGSQSQTHFNRAIPGHHHDEKCTRSKARPAISAYRPIASAEDTPPQTLTRKKFTAGLLALRSSLFAFAFPSLLSGLSGSKQLADYSCGGSPGLMTPARLHAPGSLLNTEEESFLHTVWMRL